MKNIFLLKTLISLVFITTSSYSQTYISGGINENTIWTKENSPYIITDNTVVFGDNSLTIQPGVVVKFDDNIQLRLQGPLIAIGTDTNNIIFTSNSPNPQKGSWLEVKMEGGSYTLDYIIMEYADSALSYIRVPGGSSIKNSIFRFNNNAINADPAPQFPIFIESTKFINNDKGIADFHDEVSLTNCEFINNRIGAEIVESNIESCLFEGNTELGVFVYSTKIKNSTFINNEVALHKSFSYGSFTSELSGNTIKNNVIGVKIWAFSSSGVINVSNNTICNNSAYNVENTRAGGADFSNNCWCTNDLNEIENTIQHGLDDINLGVVLFTPIETGCPDSTLSINDYTQLKKSNTFYPNPANSEIIFVNNYEKKYEIFSINGALIKKGITRDMLNISDLNNGIYMIKVFNLDHSQFVINKLVKK